MNSKIGASKLALAVALSAIPFAIASLPLVWLSSRLGVDWAYSLFNTAHPLNFGGNPAEVLSHLLNWILMAGCTAALCSVLAAISLLKSGNGWKRSLAFLPTTLFGLSLLGLLIWTGIIDSQHGEGAVVFSFVLFFGPCTALSAVAALPLLASQASLFEKVLHIVAVFALAIAFQWVYEHSGTGGPNLLAFPLLFTQLVAWWFIGRRLNRKYPATFIEFPVGMPEN